MRDWYIWRDGSTPEEDHQRTGSVLLVEADGNLTKSPGNTTIMHFLNNNPI
jgi:hypothetical protein